MADGYRKQKSTIYIQRKRRYKQDWSFSLTCATDVTFTDEVQLGEILARVYGLLLSLPAAEASDDGNGSNTATSAEESTGGESNIMPGTESGSTSYPKEAQHEAS